MKRMIKNCCILFCSMMLVSGVLAQESENLYMLEVVEKADPYLIETPAQFDAIRES